MNINIRYLNENVKTYPKGIKINDIISGLGVNSNNKNPIVAVKFNNEIVSLSFTVKINGNIEPIFLNSRDGKTLYRKSLCFLLAMSFQKLFPKRRLIISHSLSSGFYYYYDGIDKISQDDIKKLSNKIKELVRKDLNIQIMSLSYSDAIKYFKSNNLHNTALLLKYNNKSKIHVYECDDYLDIYHGPLLSHTGLLTNFELMNYPPGLLLRFPGWTLGKKIPVHKNNRLLFQIYQEYKKWGKILNIDCIGLLNTRIHNETIKEFILIAEALHNNKIADIADKICGNNKDLRLILIAGPSSSGKTTFSKKLNIQLKVSGLNPVLLSIDNYFLPRSETPVDKYGKPNFEALEAIDIKLLNDHLVKLFNGEEIEIPYYDFITGTRKYKKTKLKLTEKTLLILEGIHALNDKLTPLVDNKYKFKIYVSALTQLNIDDHNRIPTTDNRLLRRIVRDNKFRGHSILKTLHMWPSVQRGEQKYIFPFQNTADIAFNSALDYELAVLKVYANPLLKTITPDMKEYTESHRLLTFLNNILPIPPTLVPSMSILREFIGDSRFEY